MERAVIIATDNRYACGMTAVARKCAESVIILAAGSAALAESASHGGPDKVVFLELGEDTPPEAVADTVADLLAEMSPKFVMSNDDPSARVLLASAARVLDATVVGDLVSAEANEGGFSVSCSVAGGIALQQAEVSGAVAAVYGGGNLDLPTTQAPVEALPANPDELRVIEEVLPSSNMVDLSAASRIIGVGRGVKARGDLAVIEELASSLGAVMACTLPVSEDSH
ncbi:MAG: FAD-binding protein, partial [Eggerthellaceae bacterium]|nr:FAD-binding protein [Eggerthellaceae bacterium]